MPDLLRGFRHSGRIGYTSFHAADAVAAGSEELRRGKPSRRAFADGLPARAGDLSILVLLAVAGAAEGWLRRTDLASDAISYLNVRDAILSHDWRNVFNPLWSVGYPFLLALARPWFPATPQGDWNSIHLMNLLIFLATWAAFLLLLRSVPLGGSGESMAGAGERRAFLKGAGLCVFLAIELSMDAVSRVGSDLLVTLFFFLGVAAMLRLVHSPGWGRAAALGGILGLGYWVKAILLPLGVILLAIAAGVFFRQRRRAWKQLVLALVVFVLVALPNLVGISRAYGSFTWGESGALNYQFHVNLLPHWTNWQGGPLAVYGNPIHPTRQVMSNPDLFVFGEPFHDTYPPFGHISYWYKGYHSFWNGKLQAMALLRDGRDFAKILFGQPFLYGAALAFLLLWLAADDRKKLGRRIRQLWPMYVPALAGIGLYLLVHVEARYISSFIAICFMVPFLAVAGSERLPARRVRVLALALLAAGAGLNLAVVDRSVMQNALHGAWYTKDPQWMLGSYLRNTGLRSGDKVAAVGGPTAFCEWAYMDGLRVVAELGGGPYDQRHPEKTSPRATGEMVRNFWENPSLQEKVLSYFREAGAVAVMAPAKPAGLAADGWAQPPGTSVWVYRLPRSEAGDRRAGVRQK